MLLKDDGTLTVQHRNKPFAINNHCRAFKRREVAQRQKTM